MIRRVLTLTTAVLLLAGSASTASVALAGDPPVSTAVPALHSDGSVVLPDGRVLPVEPAWAHESSVQAEMLAAHAGDKPSFAPGARPQARGQANASLGLFAGDASPIIPLGLADGGRQGATLAATSPLPNGMRKEVLGFLPYWMLDAGSLQWMQYQLVTTIAYFGVAARSDGTLITSSGGSPTAGWSGWNSSAMTGVINAAHARGVRVVLTVTMMAWDGGVGQAALLGSATARAQLVNAIVATVRDRAADGVNLDFEPVATSLRDQYTSFARDLKAGLVAAGVGSYLTVCTMAGAATWASGYDLVGLTAAGAADALFVMGYDYSWSGSARAGGVAPMSSPYILDVGESVNDYLAIVPGTKIIWGVPYYGRTWQTTSGDPNALTQAGASGASKAYYYTGARDLAAAHGRRWDDVGKVPWFAYYDTANTTWVEGYYDDGISLAAKYDMVNQKNLAGMGIWTLLMDQGDPTLWNLIANKFVNDTTPPVGGIRNLPDVASAPGFTVSWTASDVGSGVASYSVQVRDRATSSWVKWLTATTATSAYFVGTPGHAYEFRVAAVDLKGNVQAWLPSATDPGATLAIGGFARVAVDGLNVRSGAGPAFTSLGQLSSGDLLAVLAGPIDAGGYQWYQVQFGFAEWPSAGYPRLGWVAAGSGGTAYLAPTKAPNVTSVGSAGGPPAAPLPSVIGIYPPAGAPGEPVGVQPSVRFDRVVAGVSSSSFVLRRADATGVAATVSNNGDSQGFTLHPLAPLEPGMSYTLSLTSAITSVEGGALTPASWNFTVAGTPAPPSGGLITYTPPRTLTFLAGSHTGYRFDSGGRVIAARTASLSRASGAPTSQRSALIPGQGGAWFQVTAGIWAGYWVRESPAVYLPGIASQTTFSPLAAVAFGAGTHTGYRFDSSGRVTASKLASLSRASGAAAGARAIINGRPYLAIVNGIWAGYWVPESASVFVP